MESKFFKNYIMSYDHLSLTFHEIIFTDIDECKVPELAAKCVENAECCNLPAYYACKCNPGFEGDGEIECLGKKHTSIYTLIYCLKKN